MKYAYKLFLFPLEDIEKYMRHSLHLTQIIINFTFMKTIFHKIVKIIIIVNFSGDYSQLEAFCCHKLSYSF